MQQYYRKQPYVYLLLFITLMVNACKTASRLPAHDLQEPQVYAIRDVNLIPMTFGKEIMEHATVVIEGKKIVAINGAIPVHATIIDGHGKWLIPGLIDMHVHNLSDANFGSSYPTKGATIFTDTQDFMWLYIANGVTTVLDLNSRAEHFGQRNEIIKGKVTGPRIALAALINGGDGGSGMIANTPSDGRQTVRIAKAAGYEFIKVYSRLDIETYKAIIDEADKQGMKVVGHIPEAFQGRIEEAFVPHFGMVAHAEEYAKQTEDLSDRDIQKFAQLAKGNGTWLTPTLTTMVRIADQARSLDSIRHLQSFPYVPPLMQSKWLGSNQYNQGTNPDRVAYFEQVIDFNNRLVKAFRNAGIPIVAGTDAGTSGVVWGFSLHDELALLVKAGLSPGEALASATRLPATWLGIEDKTGTIDTGKYADLVLLDANPLDNIQNTRKIAGVFVNGRWISRTAIDKALASLEKRNTANRDKYDWKKRKEL